MYIQGEKNMDFVNKIIQGDTIEEIKKIPDNTFDFCFADPPYFMQIEGGKSSTE